MAWVHSERATMRRRKVEQRRMGREAAKSALVAALDALIAENGDDDMSPESESAYLAELHRWRRRIIHSPEPVQERSANGVGDGEMPEWLLRYDPEDHAELRRLGYI